MYAIREVAKIRENIEERNKVTVEILLLHASLTVVGYIIMILLVATVTKIQVDILLFYY